MTRQWTMRRTPATSQGVPPHSHIVSTHREITGLKETRQALKTQHIINSVCPSIQRRGDNTINKYFLSVCMEELWRANRSDFTDSWFSSLVIAPTTLEFYKLITEKTAAREIKRPRHSCYFVFMHFLYILKAQNWNSLALQLTPSRNKGQNSKVKFQISSLFSSRVKNNWKWPCSAHFHVLLSGWAFAQL